MAIYQIFASADATIYSRYPAKNTGRDSILEISVDNAQDGLRYLNRGSLTDNPYYTYDLAANDNYSAGLMFPTQSIKRALIQFSPTDIAKLDTFASQSISSSWSASLVLHLASAQNLSTTYSLNVYAVSQSWQMGTGEYGQVPESRNGVCWLYTGPYQQSPAWSVSGSSYFTASITSQSFDYMSNKDVNIDVSGLVDFWFAYPERNYGLLVKHPDNIEQNTGSFIDLKFFSVDTHTIYPPTLQFKWKDDYYFPLQTGNYVLSDQVTVTIANNPGQFKQNQVYKMRTAVRENYPQRNFSTSSVYLTSLYFSEETCWAIQDIKTEEMVIDFDSDYTRLSADSVGNYFTLYTSGLEINRFYRILIKSKVYSTNYGPLSVYNNQQSIYNAISIYGPDSLALLPAEEVIFSGQNSTFKIVP